MSSMIARHLLDSTVFCLLISAVACCLSRRAAVRHALLLVGIAKFAAPSILLSAAGARLAFFWPATAWAAALAARASTTLAAIFGLLPSVMDGGDPGLARRALLWGWACGAVVMFAHWVFRVRGSWPKRRDATPLEKEAFARAKRRLAPGCAVRVVRSHRGSEPALIGVWRPVIAIPEGLSERLSASEFEAVLLHELAHARRLDNLVATVVHALVCVFWFHPLVWFVEERMRTERERACDEMVLRCGTAPRTYAAGILKVCQFQILRPVAGVSAIAGSDLKARLELILTGPLPARVSYLPHVAVASFAALIILAPLANGYCQECVSQGNGSPPPALMRPARAPVPKPIAALPCRAAPQAASSPLNSSFPLNRDHRQRHTQSCPE